MHRTITKLYYGCAKLTLITGPCAKGERRAKLLFFIYDFVLFHISNLTFGGKPLLANIQKILWSKSFPIIYFAIQCNLSLHGTLLPQLANIGNLFTAVVYFWAKYARVVIPGKLFLPCLMFAGRPGAVITLHFLRSNEWAQ